MQPFLNFGEYLVPLVIAEPTATGYSLDRYAGVGFYLGDDNRIATCRHIVEACVDGEILAAYSLATNSLFAAYGIRKHPVYDFATALIDGAPSHKHFQISQHDVGLGDDLQALGFTARGRDRNVVTIDARLSKGYVTRRSERPETEDSQSLMEVSFPSFKGFSGAPVLSPNTNQILGMLFSNHESTIEQFRYSELKDENKIFSESVHRVIECGLAHPASDLLKFLQEVK